jgi:hypothetical protein
MAGRYLSFEVTGARCAEDGISFSKDTQTVMRGRDQIQRDCDAWWCLTESGRRTSGLSRDHIEWDGTVSPQDHH